MQTSVETCSPPQDQVLVEWIGGCSRILKRGIAFMQKTNWLMPTLRTVPAIPSVTKVTGTLIPLVSEGGWRESRGRPKHTRSHSCGRDPCRGSRRNRVKSASPPRGVAGSPNASTGKRRGRDIGSLGGG